MAEREADLYREIAGQVYALTVGGHGNYESRCEDVAGLLRREFEHGIELEFEQPPLTPLQKIKAAALELAGTGSREDFKLAERLFKALPELRNV
jgi:hypothetical protein